MTVRVSYPTKEIRHGKGRLEQSRAWPPRARGTVAMGTGTDVAMNSAQVTLVKGDLRGIATARKLSQATLANMKQNLGYAFIYNSLGVPHAAGLLYPFTGWPLSPMIAALGVWAAEGVEAKSGPGEDSFCRVCSLIAIAMGQKAGEKWTVAAALQPTFLLPPRLLAMSLSSASVIANALRLRRAD